MILGKQGQIGVIGSFKRPPHGEEAGCQGDIPPGMFCGRGSPGSICSLSL